MDHPNNATVKILDDIIVSFMLIAVVGLSYTVPMHIYLPLYIQNIIVY